MKLPCQKSEAIESYELLLAVCKAGEDELTVGYKQMRDLLERICRAQMQSSSLQMTDLSARISFIAAKTGLSVGEQKPASYFPPDFQSNPEPLSRTEQGKTLAGC